MKDNILEQKKYKIHEKSTYCWLVLNYKLIKLTSTKKKRLN